MTTDVKPLGWWVISGEDLLSLLRRAHEGQNPDLLYAEQYANSEVDHIEPGEDDVDG